MSPIDECSCGGYEVSRRSLLKAAGLASMAGVATSMFGDVLTSTVYGSSNANVLVVLSLRGGADGLSMMVPHAEDAYYASRPTTAIAKNKLLYADSTFGLHPSFTALGPMWLLGQVAGIHAVGLPAPNRSHFEAMETLEDADPGSSARVGWINRMVSGLAESPDVFDAMQIGDTITPTSLAGPAPTIATLAFSDLAMPFSKDPVLAKRVGDSLHAQYAAAGGLIGAAGLNAIALAGRAAAISGSINDGPLAGVVYPRHSELGAALKSTAGLIRANVGVKAVAVDAGGWDHHVDLGYRVNDTVKDLARCLAAFFLDLGLDAGRVTVVTLSEFGRRLKENGSQGVDHGYGNAVFALGAGVKGGFYSRWPGLSSGRQVDGDLAVTTDYRSVLTEILRARFPALDTSKVFPGISYAPLGFMR
ncbi:DUF1501 domain-containing protein [Aeromicrobium sp. NPDC092404]|uniref:DUF1501 domain-containing protein n=1 Tax=Aeromicrobium sp. NPDC092404 TaxID=3154976 RepID=UPI00341C2A13